jgi:hypothetical protein
MNKVRTFIIYALAVAVVFFSTVGLEVALFRGMPPDQALILTVFAALFLHGLALTGIARGYLAHLNFPPAWLAILAVLVVEVLGAAFAIVML